MPQGTCKLTIMPLRDAGLVPGADTRHLPEMDDESFLQLAYDAGDLYAACAREGRAGYSTAGGSS